MANVSQQYMDDLGPLAAIWAGRDQGLAENTSLVNQQNTLEQIANSQQTRDIAKQKLPFEMSALEHTKSMQPLLRGQQETKNASDNQKLNKDRFDAFFGQFKDVLPTLPGGPQDAAVLAEIAKRNGMDPNDSRIGKMIQVGSSGNRAAIDEMLKRIALMSEASIKERAKQGDVDAAHGARTREEIAGRERVARIQADASLERAQITADARNAAKERLANVDQRLVQLTKVLNDPQADAATKAQAQQEAAQLSQYKITLATAVNQQKTDQIMQLLGQPTSGGTPTAANPYVKPKTENPQRTPEDTQALEWANANPADPRALAIKKRLGIQ